MAILTKNTDGSMERKIPEGFEKISGADFPTRELQQSNFSNIQQFGDIGQPGSFLAGQRTSGGAFGTNTEVETPEQPANPMDNFNLLLTNVLSKAQGVGTADLKKKKRELERAVLSRSTTPTAEGLRTLSPAQQEAIRTGNINALIPDIDDNAYRLAKAQDATKNFEFAFTKAQELGEEFAKNIVAPDNIIASYVQQIENGGADFLEKILATAPNDKTRNKIISELDFSKLVTKEDTSKKFEFVKGTADQPGGTFDPSTGQFTPTKVEEGQVDISKASSTNIANAIKQIESGGNYEAQGASGEFGAYQFMPGTWDQWSNEYANNVLQQSAVLPKTPENQDAVAEWKIQQWQQQGYSPDQIASLWNSGRPEYEGNVGVNSMGVKYDVPGYVNKFTNALSGMVEQPETLTPKDVDVLTAQLGKMVYGTRIANEESDRIQRIIVGTLKETPNADIGTVRESIMKELLGYSPNANQELGESLLSTVMQVIPLADFDTTGLSILLSNGNTKGALSKVENAIMKQAKSDNPDDFIGESTVVTANKRSNDINDLVSSLGADSPVGVAKGTMEEWLGRLRGKEAQAVKSKIITQVAEMRNRLSGTAVTESEERFLEPLIPKISDSPDNFMIKINQLKSMPLEQLNGMRGVYNLPALDENTLLNKDSRLGLYGGEQQTPTSGTTSSGLKYTIE